MNIAFILLILIQDHYRLVSEIKGLDKAIYKQTWRVGTEADFRPEEVKKQLSLLKKEVNGVNFEVR